MCKNREKEVVGSRVLLFLAVHEGTQMLLLWMQIGSAVEAVPWYHCWGFAAAAPSCRVDSSLSDICGGWLLSQTEERSSLSTSCPYSDCHWPWFLSWVLMRTDLSFLLGRVWYSKHSVCCPCALPGLARVMYLHGFTTLLALFNWMKITWGSVCPLYNLSDLYPVVKKHCSFLLNLSFSCINY